MKSIFFGYIPLIREEIIVATDSVIKKLNANRLLLPVMPSPSHLILALQFQRTLRFNPMEHPECNH